jgi:hypothetical protein
VVRAATVCIHRRGKHTSTTIEGLFSALSVPRSYLEDNWTYSSVAGYSPNSNDVRTEAGESSLLKFVTRKRLVETLQRNGHC